MAEQPAVPAQPCPSCPSSRFRTNAHPLDGAEGVAVQRVLSGPSTSRGASLAHRGVSMARDVDVRVDQLLSDLRPDADRCQEPGTIAAPIEVWCISGAK